MNIVKPHLKLWYNWPAGKRWRCAGGGTVGFGSTPMLAYVNWATDKPWEKEWFERDYTEMKKSFDKQALLTLGIAKGGI